MLTCISFLCKLDCEPRFTSFPNNGNPVYQLKGNSESLSWAYDPEGRTVNQKEWTFNDKQRIATVLSSGVVHIDPAYSSRVQLSGNTLTLSNIQEKDSGVYNFEVVFTTFNPRWLKNDAQLIVVGKYPYSIFTTNMFMI